jgi:hypothetical protein
MNYQQAKSSALTHLGHLQTTAQQLRDLLASAKQIRHEGYGEPEWYDALRKATDNLGRALAAASRNASVT